MAAFRILNQFPVFFGLTGLLAVGAELRFYEAGTTDPKSVYGNKALTIDNGPVIAIGTDGRTAVDIWGDGSYRVRLYAADGTLIDEADDVEIAGGDAATIPALVDGWFLTNNGALLLWAEIRQLPDPTGQDGKMVVADGAGYILQEIPEPPDPPDPDIVVTETSFQAGTSADPTKYFTQIGTGSAPASGTKSTQATVSFATPFAAAPKVFPINTSGYVTAAGDVQPTVSVTSKSSTQFTVLFSTQTGEGNSNNNIINAVNFDYLAVGTREVA